jgi:hypothetical protein
VVTGKLDWQKLTTLRHPGGVACFERSTVAYQPVVIWQGVIRTTAKSAFPADNRLPPNRNRGNFPPSDHVRDYAHQKKVEDNSDVTLWINSSDTRVRV